jgi:hypothetical protein
MPLAWYEFGSVPELLEMPITLLNRYVMMLEDEGAVDMYMRLRHPMYKR